MSLIEVMVALSVIAISIGALFAGLITAESAHRQANDMALAYQQIQAQIETYQYLPFKTVQSDFKGASFTVAGLKPWKTNPSVGTITSVYNSNNFATTSGASNPNIFGTAYSEIPLQFQCVWDENGHQMSAQAVYVLVYRGM